MFKTKRERRLKWEAEQAAKARNGSPDQPVKCERDTNDGNQSQGLEPHNHDCHDEQVEKTCVVSKRDTCKEVVMNIESDLENRTTEMVLDKVDTCDNGNHGNNKDTCLKKDDSMECNYESSQKENDDEQRMEHDGGEVSVP